MTEWDVIEKQNEKLKGVVSDLKEIYDEIWGFDIPSPTCPEYKEHHLQMQSLMKFVKQKIKKYEEVQ